MDMMISLGSATAKAVLLFASLSCSVQGHIIMTNPVPYSHATIDNSPLTSSNYPCKLTGDASTFYSTTGIENTYAVGSTQTLSFKGSATHGGGSCQLALSSDMQPSASTDWRVILSIEGGCPTTDLTGSSGPSTYNWTVPESLTPGSYSFAWTWISKEAGQAEYYMNCAPITVTAGTSTKREAAEIRRDDVSYPELFVANLADINDCETVEGSDYVYPYGGAVQNLGVPAASLKYTTITSSSCVPKGQTQGGNYLPTAGVAGGSSSGNTTAANVAAAPTAISSSPSSADATAPAATALSGSGATTFITSTSLPQSSPIETVYVSPVIQSTGRGGSSATMAGSSSGGAMTTAITSITQATATGSTSSSSSMSSSSILPSSSTLSSSSILSSSSVLPTTSTAATTSAASSSSVSPTKATAAPTGSGSSIRTMTGTCTDEGDFNCVGSQYQQCASGGWTAMRALPDGTACTQGLSTNLWAGESRRGLGPDGFIKVRKGRRARFAR